MRFSLTLWLLFLLSGCASITGYNASSDFACEAVTGEPCLSLEESYHARTPPLRAKRPLKQSASTARSLKPALKAQKNQVLTKRILRIPETLFTLYVYPWQDSDGDLHEGSTVFVSVKKAHWAVNQATSPQGRVAEPFKTQK